MPSSLEKSHTQAFLRNPTHEQIIEDQDKNANELAWSNRWFPRNNHDSH